MMRTILKALPSFLLMATLYMPSLYAFVLPEDALKLLAETTTEPCSICIEQDIKKACKLLKESLKPGTEIRTDNACRFVKSGSGGDNEIALTCYPTEALLNSLTEGKTLPQIAFTFYTPQKRLVGISETDYTAQQITELFNASRPGTVFEGELKLIAYKYGDGPAYNYLQQTNRLLIHCVVVSLKPAEK